MARPFDSADAKRLIEKHSRTLIELANSEKLTDTLRCDIIKALDALAENEVTKLLKDIPIEEINRDKKGFRVKLLQDCGYHTIADISDVSPLTLERINGIGYEGAVQIRQSVDNIISNAKSVVKIKLSEDNKSTEATKLVQAVSKYKFGEKHFATVRQLLSDNKSIIEKSINDLKPATGGLKWLFTSGSKKQLAIEAYRTLNNLINGEYYKKSQESLDAIKKINAITPYSAWIDFSENSIRFFKIIEDIAPGRIGSDDSVYGLPQELANEVQNEEFFSDGLLCDLRRYQEWGVKYALHQERVLLGDEMGLGKTIQAIATMVSLCNTGATHFVVVCPASVLANWCREISKMSRLNVTKIHGQDRQAALEQWISSGGVAVTTFETTAHFTLADDFKYSMLVVDEAHYIKNPEAQRTQNVIKISEHAQRLLFMTGTALENKVNEMVSLIKILKPDIASAVHGMEFMSSAPQFREKVAPVYYRRRREDVLTELPDLIENREWCELSKDEEEVYENAVLNKKYAEARRVSWNVSDIKQSSKAERMMEIIEEAAEDGRKVIVFSFFLDTIEKVRALLGDKCYGPINGSVAPQKRQEIIDEFDKAPQGAVLAAQIQAGGTGLNIQSASVVIFCEPQFKPSIENQAISRAYRMGQTRNVLVYRLLCEDTVDEKIISVLESKQAIFDAFADTSVAADESMELDDSTFGDIIKEEIDRINAKRGNTANVGTANIQNSGF